MGNMLFRHASFLLVVAAAASAGGTAMAVEKPVVVGIRGGVEAVAASMYSSQPEGVSGEFFVRLFLSPSFTLEAAAGYRSTSYTHREGLTSTSFSMTQVPFTAGAA